MPLRVTFVSPHRRHTSGGVYAIERFAAGLADSMQVHLAVEKGPPGTLPGVAVAAAGSLGPDDLPDADVLVVPADSGAGERLYALGPSKGRPVLLFQGYGIPGSRVVSANLDRADVAVAVARWLVEDAALHRCHAAHVAYGLDRELFTPGPPAGRRPPLVAMLVHPVSWKGTEDGLTALAKVRRAMPETQLRLFGPGCPGCELPCHESPRRDEVAQLLSRAAVYVCPSWEEGFGMPGLEALACGAALATTDTKGSRDYALHHETALVSEPRDAAGLAANVVELLGDQDLREHLASAGRAFAENHFKPWPQAAERLAQTLRRLA